MNPIYFGTSVRQLFGMYHPPRSTATRNHGVVVCPPFGQEYMRTHKALRQLTINLSKAGFHGFRFDYFGTGDSAGDGTEGTIEQWTRDIGTAIEELKDTAGLSKVTLVGLRFGATLASVAAQGRKDIDRVVLWDPVVSGKSYVAELLAAANPEGRNGRLGGQPDPVGTVGVHGFPLTKEMSRGMAALDLATLPSLGGEAAYVVVSEERSEYLRFRDDLAQRQPQVTFRHVPSAGNWDDMDRLGAALLPQEMIQGIVGILS